MINYKDIGLNSKTGRGGIMLCRECKREIRDGSEFCKYCGWKAEKDSDVSFCTSCGKQIKNDSLFCKHCGASVDDVVKVPEKDDKYKKRSLAIKVILIVLLAVVCFSLFPRDDTNNGKQIGGRSDTGTGGTGGILVDPPPGLPGNDDCFVCGGDGKKDCTSCDGGYYVEYENGSYLGYGPTTREVRKKCMVCKGSGEVKCYH